MTKHQKQLQAKLQILILSDSALSTFVGWSNVKLVFDKLQEHPDIFVDKKIQFRDPDRWSAVANISVDDLCSDIKHWSTYDQLASIELVKAVGSDVTLQICIRQKSTFSSDRPSIKFRLDMTVTIADFKKHLLSDSMLSAIDSRVRKLAKWQFDHEEELREKNRIDEIVDSWLAV